MSAEVRLGSCVGCGTPAVVCVARLPLTCCGGCVHPPVRKAAPSLADCHNCGQTAAACDRALRDLGGCCGQCVHDSGPVS